MRNSKISPLKLGGWGGIISALYLQTGISCRWTNVDASTRGGESEWLW